MWRAWDPLLTGWTWPRDNWESLGSLTMDREVHVNGTKNRKDGLAATGIAPGEVVRVWVWPVPASQAGGELAGWTRLQTQKTPSEGLSLRGWSGGWSGMLRRGVSAHFLLQQIFPSQGSNPRLLPWQADSLLLSHKGRLYVLPGYGHRRTREGLTPRGWSGGQSGRSRRRLRAGRRL